MRWQDLDTDPSANTAMAHTCTLVHYVERWESGVHAMFGSSGDALRPMHWDMHQGVASGLEFTMVQVGMAVLFLGTCHSFVSMLTASGAMGAVLLARVNANMMAHLVFQKSSVNASLGFT